MITPTLEKLLLSGKAKYKVYNLGLQEFAQIQIPQDSFIIIHKIIWHGFNNQFLNDLETFTINDLTKYNEYQLKIKSDKESPLYYIMRNEIEYKYFGSIPLDVNRSYNISDFRKYFLMLPTKPVIIDTWVTSYSQINFNITRNRLDFDVNTTGFLNNYANENDIPNGISNQQINLDVRISANGTTQTINTPSVKTTYPPLGTTPPNDNTQNYFQLFAPKVLNDNGSFLNDPSTGTPLNAMFITHPLMTFEYVEINKQSYGNI